MIGIQPPVMATLPQSLMAPQASIAAWLMRHPQFRHMGGPPGLQGMPQHITDPAPQPMGQQPNVGQLMQQSGYGSPGGIGFGNSFGLVRSY